MPLQTYKDPLLNASEADGRWLSGLSVAHSSPSLCCSLSLPLLVSLSPSAGLPLSPFTRIMVFPNALGVPAQNNLAL